MRIHMDKDGNVISAEVLTKAHESGINCSRDENGAPIEAAGRIAQAAFDGASAERLVAKQNDFNGEALVTSAKFVGE